MKENIMIQIFVNDFMEARETEKQITNGVLRHEITIKNGVQLLNDKMGYVRRDIATLDDDARDKLAKTMENMFQKCKEKKQQIKSHYLEPTDPIEDENYTEWLANEDLKRLSSELKYVQRLAYEKGWLD